MRRAYSQRWTLSFPRPGLWIEGHSQVKDISLGNVDYTNAKNKLFNRASVVYWNNKKLPYLWELINDSGVVIKIIDWGENLNNDYLLNSIKFFSPKLKKIMDLSEKVKLPIKNFGA